MFFEDIRSERLLMRLVADKLSVRWFLGYDLNESLPDHSSLTRTRTRYGITVFRRFFETIVEQCVQAKLVWGREWYVDATKVNANADLDSLVPRFAVEAREAHLAALCAAQKDEAPPEPPDSAGQSDATPTPLPVSLPDALREELAQENAARHDWIAEEGRPHREASGVSQRVADVRISTTDPDATAMRLKGGGTHLGYQVHSLIDGGKRRIILGALQRFSGGLGERAIPGMLEPAKGIAARHRSHRRSDGLDQRLVSPCGCPTQAGFDLGERLLDRGEVGGVRRQIQQATLPGFHQLANALSLMCSQVVQDDDLAWLQLRGQHLAHIRFKGASVHPAFDGH
jgi:hypothetical protein